MKNEKGSEKNPKYHVWITLVGTIIQMNRLAKKFIYSKVILNIGNAASKKKNKLNLLKQLICIYSFVYLCTSGLFS